MHADVLIPGDHVRIGPTAATILNLTDRHDDPLVTLAYRTDAGALAVRRVIRTLICPLI